MTHKNFLYNSGLNLPQARTDMIYTHARTSYDSIFFSIFFSVCVISRKGKGGLTSLPNLIDYILFTLSNVYCRQKVLDSVTISTIRGYEDRWYRRIDSGRNLEYSHS